MLAVPRAYASGKTYRTDVAASTAPGQAITASGTTHTKGTTTQIGADLTEDILGFWLCVSAGAAPSTADARALLSLYIDLAGGTTWTEFIANLNICGIGVSVIRRDFWIPMRIPAGAALAAAHQAAIASDVVEVTVYAETPSAPWVPTTFAYCDTYGADTAASEGTLISTGNQGASGAEGTWVQVEAAADRDYKAVMLGLGIDGADTSVNARGLAVDIGIDPDGGSSYIPLVENIPILLNSTEEINPLAAAMPYGCDIPEGASLAVRISNSGTATEAYSVILHCFA